MPLEKPPTIEDKAFAAVDDQWRTAREIYVLVDDGAALSTRTALMRLADAGRIERRYDPDRNGQISRYRRIEDKAAAAH